MKKIPLLFLVVLADAQTLYDFGNPTADEQAYIEYINRARANPPAEGARLASTTDTDVLGAYSTFSVDLAMMQTEFSAIAAAQPLAPNKKLTDTARFHTSYLFTNALQTHFQASYPVTMADRVTVQGYSYAALGENVYSYAKSNWHGHAGFNVDWGGGTGGMQSPRGHRTTIHNSNYREIGVGVTNGYNTVAGNTVGPYLVTQDFAQPSGSTYFGTGVAYYDLNGNNFYDSGEGISGLTVNVSGASYYCNTASGGGWAMPIPSTAATRTVTFSGLGINQNVSMPVTANQNAKADLMLTYTPPSITSSTTANVTLEKDLSFTTIGGASSYTWKKWNTNIPAAENCENASNVTITKTGTYSTLSTTVFSQGTAAFRLMHMTEPDQIIELNTVFYGQTGAAFSFQKRLRYSGAGETAYVQIKEEGANGWTTLHSQTGTDSPGDSAFSTVNLSLTAYEGKLFRLRFIYKFSSGAYYNVDDPLVGWYIDAINFTNLLNLSGSTTQTITGSPIYYEPENTGTFVYQLYPIISGKEYPGAAQLVTVSGFANYAAYAAAHEAAYSLVASILTNNPSADYDGDGKSNLLEYAFSGKAAVSEGDLSNQPTRVSDTNFFILEYKKDTGSTDLTFTPQGSTDLIAWKSPGQSGALTGFVDSLISTTGTVQTRQMKVPYSSSSRAFLRMYVTKP